MSTAISLAPVPFATSARGWRYLSGPVPGTAPSEHGAESTAPSRRSPPSGAVAVARVDEHAQGVPDVARRGGVAGALRAGDRLAGVALRVAVLPLVAVGDGPAPLGADHAPRCVETAAPRTWLGAMSDGAEVFAGALLVVIVAS